MASSDLAKLDKLIAETRARIAGQREIVANMETVEIDTKAATRLLRTMESTLVDLETDRRALEDERFGGGEQHSSMGRWSSESW